MPKTLCILLVLSRNFSILRIGSFHLILSSPLPSYPCLLFLPYQLLTPSTSPAAGPPVADTPHPRPYSADSCSAAAAARCRSAARLRNNRHCFPGSLAAHKEAPAGHTADSRSTLPVAAVEPCWSTRRSGRFEASLLASLCRSRGAGHGGGGGVR
jgi:hypothetical protein